MTELKSLLKDYYNKGTDVDELIDTLIKEYDNIKKEEESKKINEEVKAAALDRAMTCLNDYLQYTKMDKDTKLLFINQLSKFLAGAGPSGKFEFSYGIKDNDKDLSIKTDKKINPDIFSPDIFLKMLAEL